MYIDDVVLAGTDTTAVTISWGFLRISSMPEIQKKIQEEIDAFVNKYGRVPFFWEREEVPYMIAVQRECMRTRPPTEVGVAHAVSQDRKLYQQCKGHDFLFIKYNCIFLYFLYS